MTVDEAIKVARVEVKDPYALAYLQAIPEAIQLDGVHAFRVQLLYALNNMKSWRGETAREVKKVLKAFASK